MPWERAPGRPGKHFLFPFAFRANALEEQLKEQELRAQEMVLEEARKQKELLCRMEREKSIEIENLQARWVRCPKQRNPPT